MRITDLGQTEIPPQARPTRKMKEVLKTVQVLNPTLLQVIQDRKRKLPEGYQVLNGPVNTKPTASGCEF